MAFRALSAIGAIALLAGCGQEPTAGPSHHGGGRYEGVGIATPGEGWTKAADAPKSSSDDVATLSDDDYVVFGTDTKTGEIRECGDRSGFCISIQPWAKPATPTPVKLTEHKTAKTDGSGVSNIVDAGPIAEKSK